MRGQPVTDHESIARTTRIAALNDELRTTMAPSLGKLMVTPGVSEDPTIMVTVLAKVRQFNNFEPGDDPYGEHDFGAIKHRNVNYFWKIDYYAPDLEHASEDPADPKQTTRVLTIMLASEY